VNFRPKPKYKMLTAKKANWLFVWVIKLPVFFCVIEWKTNTYIKLPLYQLNVFQQPQ